MALAAIERRRQDRALGPEAREVAGFYLLKTSCPGYRGIVSVQAKDKATGKEQQIRIQSSGGLSDITGFPAWLRVNHFLNLFFMAFTIRASIQILAGHPRLY